jgi:hypothetical protein
MRALEFCLEMIMSALKNPRHEAFALARFRGLTVPEAYREAGYVGKGDHNCTVVNRRADVRARVAELHQGVAERIAYEKLDAVKDLVTIIRALPSEARKGHPLAEGRWSSAGRFYRFPDKLEALAQLIRLMGWDEPVKVDASATVGTNAEPPRDTFVELLASIRKGPQKPVKFWPVSWEPEATETGEKDKLQNTNCNEEGEGTG